MKEKYQAPGIEIIEVENEGVMANSTSNGNGTIYDFSGENPMFSSGTRSASGNMKAASPLQELEDIINDILTVKK